MRTAIISPLPPEKPGESIYTARLIEALAEDLRIEIVAIGGTSSKPLGIRTGHVETANIWRGRSLLYPLRLWQFIKRKRAHLVHVQFGPHGEVYGGMYGEVMLILLLLLKHTGVRTTVTLHSTWMLEDVRKRIRETSGVSKLQIFAPALFKLYMKVLDWATNTIQLSTVKLNSSLKQRFLSEFDVPEEKVLEIPHPCTRVSVRVPKREARNQLGIEEKEPVLMFGFVRRDKGIHLAMQAIKSVSKTIPNVLLLVAGKPFDQDGEKYLQELLEFRREAGLEKNVRFDVEYIPEDRAPIYFLAASIILAPYTESVGASGPLHTACGYGTPIVASNAGLHIGEALGGNVIIFEKDSVKDLSEKIRSILENRGFAQEVGDNLLRYSESESWSLAAKRTNTYYRRTLGIG